MNLSKIAVGLSAVGLLAVAAPSFAIPSLTWTSTNFGTQTVDPFGGIDWNSAGTAVSVGFNPAVANSVITTTYWANAVGIKDPNGGTYATPGINPPAANGWEFTIKAVITETSICLLTADFNATPVSALNPCISALFVTVNGSYDVYFDPLADANLVTGAGITDGDVVLSGTVNSGVAGSFNVTGPGSGTGAFSFKGAVTYTNNAYINPDLDFSRATTTLQIGGDTGGWQAPTSQPNGGGGTTGLPANYLAFQADGNQTFGIPEPGTLALLGLGLVGAVVGSRRRVA